MSTGFIFHHAYASHTTNNSFGQDCFWKWPMPFASCVYDKKPFATTRHWNDLANCCAGAGLAEPVLSVSLVRWFSIARFPIIILFQVVCHGYTNTDAPPEWRTGSLGTVGTSLKTNTFSCNNAKTHNTCPVAVPRYSHCSNMLTWLFLISYNLSVTIIQYKIIFSNIIKYRDTSISMVTHTRQ